MKNKKKFLLFFFSSVIFFLITLVGITYYFTYSLTLKERQANDKVADLDAQIGSREKYDFKIDYYKVSSLYKDIEGDETVKAYDTIVAAYLNYETSCQVDDNVFDKANIWGMVDTNFPLFYVDVDIDSISYSYRTHTYTWKYKDTYEEHAALIANFEKTINEYMSALYQGDTDAIKALTLYKELTENSEYNYDALTDYSVEKTRTYEALVNHSGICSTYARAYAFLLTQVGINAVEASGPANGANHAWTLFELDGKYYYADPTWDLGGISLGYFGITADYRASENGGTYAFAETTIFSYGDYSVSKYFAVNDPRFSKLWFGYNNIGMSYRIDRINNELIYTVYSNDKETNITIDLNTLTQ